MADVNNQAASEQDIFDRIRSNHPGDSSKLARSYYDSILIDMRYIDSVPADTSCTVYGHKFSSPLTVSSISHLGKFGYGESGMVQTARAAKELNILNFVGAGSEEELEQIIETGAKTVKIIKPFADKERIFRKIEHAEKSGCFAVGMDIDHIFNKDGDYDQVDGALLERQTAADIAAYVKATKLPFIVKGVLSAQDAEKCLNAGVKGIFVSHHHGLYKFITPPAMVLPEIVKAVNGRCPIFIDGNIESGYDAFKALALGADVTAVGRPLLKLIKKEGSDGVKRWFEENTKQLRGVMSRSGCACLADIDETHIHKIF